jgi:nucleotide-binding universal stress UspA family protein
MAERILICTSFSDGLSRFTDCVLELGAAGFKQVTFFHCIPLEATLVLPQGVDETRVEAARDHLRPALAHQSSTLAVNVIVEVGLPAERIQAIADKVKPDLIVVGTAQRTLLDEKLFGSTTAKLAQQVRVPLLILRPQMICVYTREELALRARHLLRALLIPFDGSPASQYLVNFMRQWLEPLPQVLVEQALLCWVTEASELSASKSKPEAKINPQLLEAAQSQLRAAGLQVSQTIRYGQSLSEIEAVAIEQSFSAIAIASSHFGKLLEWSIPSFAGELIRRSWHPIFYVPMYKPD